MDQGLQSVPQLGQPGVDEHTVTDAVARPDERAQARGVDDARLTPAAAGGVHDAPRLGPQVAGPAEEPVPVAEQLGMLRLPAISDREDLDGRTARGGVLPQRLNSGAAEVRPPLAGVGALRAFPAGRRARPVDGEAGRGARGRPVHRVGAGRQEREHDHSHQDRCEGVAGGPRRLIGLICRLTLAQRAARRAAVHDPPEERRQSSRGQRPTDPVLPVRERAADPHPEDDDEGRPGRQRQDFGRGEPRAGGLGRGGRRAVRLGCRGRSSCRRRGHPSHPPEISGEYEREQPPAEPVVVAHEGAVHIGGIGGDHHREDADPIDHGGQHAHQTDREQALTAGQLEQLAVERGERQAHDELVQATAVTGDAHGAARQMDQIALHISGNAGQPHQRAGRLGAHGSKDEIDAAPERQGEVQIADRERLGARGAPAEGRGDRREQDQRQEHHVQHLDRRAPGPQPQRAQQQQRAQRPGGQRRAGRGCKPLAVAHGQPQADQENEIAVRVGFLLRRAGPECIQRPRTRPIHHRADHPQPEHQGDTARRLRLQRVPDPLPQRGRCKRCACVLRRCDLGHRDRSLRLTDADPMPGRSNILQAYFVP